MDKLRHWVRSGLAQNTSLYVEIYFTNYADGMPKQETTLLATVYRDRQQYDAVIEADGGDVFMPGFPSELAAYKAVIEYLLEHEKRQLLCSQGAEQ